MATETAVAEPDLSVYDNLQPVEATALPAEDQPDLSVYDALPAQEPPPSEAPDTPDLSVYDSVGTLPQSQTAVAQTNAVADQVNASTPTTAAPYGFREDGTPKGNGFLGLLKRPDGQVSSELSIGVNLDGKETLIPSLVPTLNQEEVQSLLDMPKGQAPSPEIVAKATDYARGRIAQGKSPFAGEGEQVASQDFGIPNLTELRKGNVKTAQQLEAQEPPAFKNAVDAGTGFIEGLVPHSLGDVARMTAPQTFESTQQEIARSEPEFKAVMATPPYSKERFSHWLNLGGLILA